VKTYCGWAITLVVFVVSAAGDFVGDITDDVSSLDAESCLGLVGWLDFYHTVRRMLLCVACLQRCDSLWCLLAALRLFVMRLLATLHCLLCRDRKCQQVYRMVQGFALVCVWLWLLLFGVAAESCLGLVGWLDFYNVRRMMLCVACLQRCKSYYCLLTILRLIILSACNSAWLGLKRVPSGCREPRQDGFYMPHRVSCGCLLCLLHTASLDLRGC
jgi:hypothetical protein